jgi:steroid 5-alpha reductase family enzyme
VSFPVAQLFLGMGSSLLAVAVLMAISFAIGAATGKYSIIDAVWGPGFVLIALVSFLVSIGHGQYGDPTLRWVALIAVALWGLRLGGYILLRNHGLPEDPRYVKMLEGHSKLRIVGKVQVPQGLLMWFVSLPVQVAMLLSDPALWLVWVGAVIWLVGIAFESIGDAQLARFKSDPAHKGQLMKYGLWRFTRHPNYFGDSAVWWGLFVMVAWTWIGWLTILSPIVMTYLLVAKSGKALTEKRMAKSKPGYAEYVATTSGFVPLPPKKSSSTKTGNGTVNR